MTTRNRFSDFDDDPFFRSQPGQPSEFRPFEPRPPNRNVPPNFGGGLTVQSPTNLGHPAQTIQGQGQTSNPFIDFLEEEPNLPFQAALQRGNLTPNQLQFFQGQRKNIFDRFEGLLGNQIQQGQLPNLRFNDFINDFDFNREFQLAPPSQRPGGSGNRLNPRTTFLR